MIKFVIKGVLRDRHRSLFPIIIVAVGVMLTVLVHCWVNGILLDMVDFNARFNTGHVKVVTKAYSENMDQSPNDLAILGVDTLVSRLKADFPDMDWVERIRFGGLLDAPDEYGETKNQGTVIGFAVDLLSNDHREEKRLNIKEALVRGRLPEKSGEILISDGFAKKLEAGPGEAVTLISSTMYGSMSMANYTICGTVNFGVTVMDKGAMIMDIRDAQKALDMDNAAGEILGYANDGFYDNKRASQIKQKFNSDYSDAGEEFAPTMLRLRDQQSLAELLDTISSLVKVFIVVFVLAMSLVLWNAGLLGGLRRFGEMGLRLAIGEHKGHVYLSLIYESVMIGLVGSVIGTIIGLGISYLLQTHGINFGSAMQNATMMLPSTYRAQITTPAFYIGFIPGLFSTVVGTMLSGIGIYRRQTAQLFKELEV